MAKKVKSQTATSPKVLKTVLPEPIVAETKVVSIRKTGRTSSLPISKRMLALAGITEGSKVCLTASKGTLVIQPATDETLRQQRLDECLDEVMEEWGDVLKRLAQ